MTYIGLVDVVTVNCIVYWSITQRPWSAGTDARWRGRGRCAVMIIRTSGQAISQRHGHDTAVSSTRETRRSGCRQITALNICTIITTTHIGYDKVVQKTRQFKLTMKKALGGDANTARWL